MNLSLFSTILRRLGSIRQVINQLLRQLTKPDNHSLVLNAALDMSRSKSGLLLENALLRQQLAVLQRQIQRPKLSWHDRTLIVLLASKLRSWKQALVIVQPDTVLRWHRDLFRRIWRRKTKSNKKPGRPPLTDQVVTLIKQMAEENRIWGAKRIQGAVLLHGIALPGVAEEDRGDLIVLLTQKMDGDDSAIGDKKITSILIREFYPRLLKLPFPHTRLLAAAPTPLRKELIAELEQVFVEKITPHESYN